MQVSAPPKMKGESMEMLFYIDTTQLSFSFILFYG
jgi:hypothetical protein